MTTGRYAVRLDIAWDLFFALDTTVLRKFAIHSDIQAEETPDPLTFLMSGLL